MVRRPVLIGYVLLVVATAVACAGCTSFSSGVEVTAVPVSPGSPDQTGTLTVFAAASLTDPFRELGQTFEARYPGTRVVLNFDSSQRLRLQIEQGAQADVFASASERYVRELVDAGLIPALAPVTFARNRMVVILPHENPAAIETLRDLARPGLKLVLAAEGVPVGAYARQVLENLSSDSVFGSGFAEAVLRNVASNEDTVKQVVAKVQLGEADAGIVYESDVALGPAAEVLQIAIPDRFNVEATYPVAVLDAAREASLASEFVRFLLQPEAQQVLERWGFIPAVD